MTFAHLQLSSLEQLQYKTQCVSGSCAVAHSLLAEWTARLPLLLGGLNRAGRGIPRDRALPEVRFVGHVARQSGVVSEHGVFCNLLVILDALEISPKMRLFVIPRI